MANTQTDTSKTAGQLQSERDRATIKIQLIENAILVGAGAEGWFSFATWEGKGGASEHIAMRLERLKDKRTGAPKGGC